MVIEGVKSKFKNTYNIDKFSNKQNRINWVKGQKEIKQHTKGN